MQHIPSNKDSKRAAPRRTRGEEVHRDAEEHRDQDEIDATADWLSHIEAGRIEVR